MDVFAELWAAAKQAGPFASLILLAALWAVNSERKEERHRYEELVKKVHRAGRRYSRDVAGLARRPEQGEGLMDDSSAVVFALGAATLAAAAYLFARVLR